jgi:hypothetical protein
VPSIITLLYPTGSPIDGPPLHSTSHHLETVLLQLNFAAFLSESTHEAEPRCDAILNRASMNAIALPNLFTNVNLKRPGGAGSAEVL